MRVSRSVRALAAVVLVGTLGLTACGSDDDEPASSGEDVSSTTKPAPVVDVTGVDYTFQGLAATVEAGTKFTFTNGSEKEAHEMVLVRVKDDETRSVEELLELPEEEAQTAVDTIGVSVAAELGKEGQIVDGKLEAAEPGRYIALCFIQVGTTPEKMAAMMESEGPPPEDPTLGPPHFTQGMVREFTVS